MKISFESFKDELLKIAFDWVAADKVLQLAKKIQLPKASSKIVPYLGASPGFKSMSRDAQRVGRLVGVEPEVITQTLAETPGGDIARRLKKAIYPGKTHPAKLLRGEWTNAKAVEREGGPEFTGKLTDILGPEPLHLPSEQMKMMNAVVKGHELDEIGVRGALGTAHLGHRSPDVIFREHNRLMTLPKGSEPVRDFMKAVRQKREGAWLFPKGLTYGESPRLSRHARKRMGEIVQRKTIDSASQAAERNRAFLQSLEELAP